MSVDVSHWPIWDWLSLTPAKASANNSIFGFSEYLATLALLLVVITLSDFKYRYRLAVHQYNLRKWSFRAALSIGIAILLIDVWFENVLPIPKVLNNANNLKAFIGLVFLILVFYDDYAASVRPVSFTRGNARLLFDATRHFIQQGNPERMVTIAEELAPALSSIITAAAKIPVHYRNLPQGTVPIDQACGHDFLLLIADERFCRAVVDRSPEFAIRVIWEVNQHSPLAEVPITQFAHNVGHEFIRNINSTFYQEESGFATGLFGYERPVTNLLFGTYTFIERCANDGRSPLGVTLIHREFSEFDEKRMKGFCRAGLALLAGYLKFGSGTGFSHAVRDLFRSFEGVLSGTYRMGETGENYRRTPEYDRLTATVEFASDVIRLIEKNSVLPGNFRKHEFQDYDIYDYLSEMIFNAIMSVSGLKLSRDANWQIQYGVVWGRLFGISKGKTNSIVRLKIRRALYDEIKRMDEFANFQGAYVLGYVLNIFGLKPMRRHDTYRRDFYPLQAAALRWMKKNYAALLEKHPHVAAACVGGSISYDAEQHQLVKTYKEGGLGKEPHREYFKLDIPTSPTIE